MPGCVKVHKENAKNPKNRNKMLVDDDPKGNTVLCESGGATELMAHLNINSDAIINAANAVIKRK